MRFTLKPLNRTPLRLSLSLFLSFSISYCFSRSQSVSSLMEGGGGDLYTENLQGNGNQLCESLNGRGDNESPLFWNLIMEEDGISSTPRIADFAGTSGFYHASLPKARGDCTEEARFDLPFSRPLVLGFIERIEKDLGGEEIGGEGKKEGGDGAQNGFPRV